MSEDQDAIRVLTIHKAKGLEFPVVILPYCHWSLDHRGPNPEILWCHSETAPFNELNLLPVKYSGALRETYFEQAYLAERFRIYIDHLNLMYVAFTRARDGLFIFAPLPGKEKLTDAADVLFRFLKNPPDNKDASLNGGEAGMVWTAGDVNTLAPSRIPKDSDQIQIRDLYSHEFSGKLRLQYRGINFFDTAAEQRIHQGNLMHELFSRIVTSKDVDRAVKAIRREGMVDEEEAERLLEDVQGLIVNPLVKDWFEGGWQVIAEKDILIPGGTLKRPDRVMIRENRVVVVDYKFGQMKAASHRSQVRKYTEMLGQMGYERVDGFIWYVNLEEVIEA